jgi:hypothetical protein
MRTLLGLIVIVVLGCTGSGKEPNDPGPDAPGNQIDARDEGPGPETCIGGNNCVCPGAQDCNHTCSAGAVECHVQGQSGPVDVACNNNVECHIACTGAPSCEVECGGSAECHVSCPDNNCTVTNCVNDCRVTCGANGAATMTGTTASCP